MLSHEVQRMGYVQNWHCFMSRIGLPSHIVPTRVLAHDSVSFPTGRAYGSPDSFYTQFSPGDMSIRDQTYPHP